MSRYSAARPLLIGIDGRSGSGKTVLSTALAETLSADHQVTVLRLEDLYRGWDGLRAGMDIFIRDVLPRLAAGETSTYLTWVWHTQNSPCGAPGPEEFTDPSQVT